DVVEVSPSYDASGATAIAASQVAMELCCLYCSNLKEKRHA
ncbi:MAG: arginase family protein, partial [Pseudomonadota bacterium]